MPEREEIDYHKSTDLFMRKFLLILTGFGMSRKHMICSCGKECHFIEKAEKNVIFHKKNFMNKRLTEWVDKSDNL